MIWQRYRFIGADGSMGYRKGQVYRLIITDWVRPIIWWPTCCPYDNWVLFAENWEPYYGRK